MSSPEDVGEEGDSLVSAFISLQSLAYSSNSNGVAEGFTSRWFASACEDAGPSLSLRGSRPVLCCRL